MEERPVRIILVDYPKLAEHLGIRVPDDLTNSRGAAALIVELQCIHDVSGPEYWETKFEDIAKDFELTLPEKETYVAHANC